MFMLWLLPLWLADLLPGSKSATSIWLRLTCGAVGIGIGTAVVVGWGPAVGESPLGALAIAYIVLGAFNCWIGNRVRRPDR